MFKNHMKIAWRSLNKRKGFAFINILGLSLGFGCSILVFLFVQHHLQFDNFHHNSDRIYRFNTEEHRDYIDYNASVPPGFSNAFKQDYDYAELMAKIADWGESQITVEGNGTKDQYIDLVAFAEPDFFKIFNFPLISGSDFKALDEPNTAFITESAAERLYGSENPINKTFSLENQETITVKGVLKDLPATTLFQHDVFVSYPTIKDYFEFLGGEYWGGVSGNLQVFGLLRPNQNIQEIEEAVAAFVPKHRPNSKTLHKYKLQPLSDIHFNSQYGGIDGKILWIFSFIGLFILVVACINFINISTAQSTYRSKEVGVRKVLGGQKGGLFWQFMAETFLVSLLALALGAVLCFFALPAFNAMFDLELSFRGLLNLEFLGFVVLLLVLVALLAGSYPGILLARIAPVLALKRKLSQNDAGGYLTRKTLVVAQFTISIVLIIGSIVIGKQLKYAIDSDLGFQKDGIVMVNIPKEMDAVQLNALKERLSNNTAIENVSACFGSPGAAGRNWGTSMKYNNKPESEDFNIQIKMADVDYLKTFDLKLLAGRNFVEKDTIDEVVVNKTLANKLGLSNPEELLNKEIKINGDRIQAKIVGVIDDFHDQDFHQNINPVFIAPNVENYGEMAVKIHLTNTKSALQHIESEWSKTFPEYIFDYTFLDDRVAELYESEQRFLSLIGVFSGLAIFIGCLGIYGLILFFVVQKTKEIGIRKVLGAGMTGLVGLVVQDFFKLIAIAGLIATPIAWYFMNNWLENFEYRTTINWWIFVLAVAIVMAITLLTISHQAIKAALANPVKSLRAE